jgi:hypothetical protein
MDRDFAKQLFPCKYGKTPAERSSHANVKYEDA